METARSEKYYKIYPSLESSPRRIFLHTRLTPPALGVRRHAPVIDAPPRKPLAELPLLPALPARCPRARCGSAVGDGGTAAS